MCRADCALLEAVLSEGLERPRVSVSIVGLDQPPVNTKGP